MHTCPNYITRVHPISGKSLEEVHTRIETVTKKSYWRKPLALIGIANLISVGFMDPGKQERISWLEANWDTG